MLGDVNDYRAAIFLFALLRWVDIYRAMIEIIFDAHIFKKICVPGFLIIISINHSAKCQTGWVVSKQNQGYPNNNQITRQSLDRVSK